MYLHQKFAAAVPAAFQAEFLSQTPVYRWNSCLLVVDIGSVLVMVIVSVVEDVLKCLLNAQMLSDLTLLQFLPIDLGS